MREWAPLCRMRQRQRHGYLSGRRRHITAAALVVLAACAPAGSGDIATGQAVIDLSDALNGLREENAILQEDMDSLRSAVARQDTLVRRIASLNGLLTGE